MDADFVQSDSGWSSSAVPFGAHSEPAASATTPKQTLEFRPEQVQQILDHLDLSLTSFGDNPAEMNCEAHPRMPDTVDFPLTVLESTNDVVPLQATHLQTLDAQWVSTSTVSATRGPQDAYPAVTMDQESAEDLSSAAGMYWNLFPTPDNSFPIVPVAGSATMSTREASATRLKLDPNMQMYDQDCIAILEQLCGETADIDFEDLVPMTSPSQGNSVHMDTKLLATPPSAQNDHANDISMTDEDCLAQLEDLCKDIKPAVNPEAELEQILEILSGIESREGTAFDSLSHSSIVPKQPDSTVSAAYMQLKDIVDVEMILDISGPKFESHDVTGSRTASIDMDDPIVKNAWKEVEIVQKDTICPLDLYTSVHTVKAEQRLLGKL